MMIIDNHWRQTGLKRGGAEWEFETYLFKFETYLVVLNFWITN